MMSGPLSIDDIGARPKASARIEGFNPSLLFYLIQKRWQSNRRRLRIDRYRFAFDVRLAVSPFWESHRRYRHRSRYRRRYRRSFHWFLLVFIFGFFFGGDVLFFSPFWFLNRFCLFCLFVVFFFNTFLIQNENKKIDIPRKSIRSIDLATILQKMTRDFSLTLEMMTQKADQRMIDIPKK